jgi:outer membrane protein TolC
MRNNRAFLRPIVLTFSCFVLLLGTFPANAQNSREPILTLDSLFRRIAQTHPIARQASLFNQQASAELLMARGAFDPTVGYNTQSKTYDSKEYYDYREASVKGNTVLGPSLKIAREEAMGLFINPDQTTPSEGLLFVGGEFPIGRGLLFDERRAALQQARTFHNMARADQQLLLNDLFYETGNRYAKWLESSQTLVVAELGVRLAEQRLSIVRARIRQGDLAPIDSVEAQIEVQLRQVTALQARLEAANARLGIENQLWNANLTFDTLSVLARIDTSTSPPPPSDSLVSLMGRAQLSHPKLRQLALKNLQLGFDLRLSRQNLLPQVNVSAGVLQPGTRLGEGLAQPNSWGNNYKLGVDVYLPIFLRKERGKLLLTQTKLQDNNLESLDVRRTIELKVRQSFNEVQNSYAQYELQEQQVRSTLLLLQAERISFETGESTIFLINQRERTYLTARQKLAELQAKYLKASIALRYAAAELPLGYVAL